MLGRADILKFLPPHEDVGYSGSSDEMRILDRQIEEHRAAVESTTGIVRRMLESNSGTLRILGAVGASFIETVSTNTNNTTKGV